MAISSKGEDSRFLKTVSQCIPIFQYLFTFFPSISINSLQLDVKFSSIFSGVEFSTLFSSLSAESFADTI